MRSGGSALSAPAPDEIEISLFGPGFGEGLAVHVGDGRWMLVDSCVNRDTGRSASLDYLAEIGVGCRDAVRAVVASHWHDDHVRRFAEVVARCEQATVFFSSAFGHSEFLSLVEAKPGTTRITGGAREMAAVIAALRERRQNGAGPDVVNRLVVEEVNVYKSELSAVTALSPSSSAVENAIKAFASLLPESPGAHLRVVAPSKNEASVVLWVDGPGCSALLGADLQRESADDRGWGRIVALGGRGEATLVKVPHHGGESGHDQRMWDQLLGVHPQALITPWKRGGKLLPTDGDRVRICELAPDASIVGLAQASPRRLDSAVERTLKEAAKNRSVVGNNAGHVRARCAPADAGQWRVERIRDAHPLCTAA